MEFLAKIEMTVCAVECRVGNYLPKFFLNLILPKAKRSGRELAIKKFKMEYGEIICGVQNVACHMCNVATRAARALLRTCMLLHKVILKLNKIFNVNI